MKRLWLEIASAFLLIAIAACQEPSSPSNPDRGNRSAMRGVVPQRGPALLDDRLASIAQLEPTFGGLYFDEARRMHVVVTDTSRPGTALRDAITAYFPRASLRSAPMVVEKGRYGFADLYRWRQQLPAVVTSVPGAHYSEIDERRNRLLIGIKDESSRQAVEDALARLHVPREAVIIEVRPPAQMAATLQSESRPLILPYSRAG